MALLPLASFADAPTSGQGANTTYKFNWYVTDDGNTATITSFVDGATKGDIVIPATVDFPREEGATATTFKVTEIKSDAFKKETGITSVAFESGSNLITINSTAFTECTNLTSIDFTNATNLTTISANAFEKCSKLASIDFTGATNLTTIGGQAFIKTAIATFDISATKVTTINRLFTDDDNDNATLTTVSLPKTVDGIIGSAFENCTALTTVTFAALNNSSSIKNVRSIGASAFKNTAITTLNLTNTKIGTLNQLFEDVNTKVTTVILPKTLATIKANAFDGLSQLTTINFDACNTDMTIEANAFKNTMKLTSLVLPAKVVDIQADAFKGSYFTELTITSHGTDGKPTIAATGATKVTTLTVNGNFKGVFNANAFTSLETVTFEGQVAAGALLDDSFAGNTNLTEVNFNGDLATGAVDGGAFAYNGIDLTVNYEPSDDADGLYSFVQNAFADDNTNMYVTFNTTEAYGTFLEASVSGKTPLYGVTVVHAVSPDGTIAVYNNGSGSYYYASYIVPASGITIAKNQGTEENPIKVMVYGAYVDNADKTAILMNQFHLMNGKYYIPGGTAIIVKSSSSVPVGYTVGNSGLNSITYSQYGTQSELHYYGDDTMGEGTSPADTYATTIIEYAAALATPQDVYFLKPIAEYGYGWSKFKADRVISAGQFYLLADPTATSAPRIVWLDGSEDDVTGIETVETEVQNNGVIYNMAGQKVDASYKGVIIKNGKKYFQK